uniref:Uncharacterized protein n=1 Tax=Callorhinchus milii TaxID=7868 RepID=A0A4W3JRM9_CALMI
IANQYTLLNLKDEITCSICLQLFIYPVTLNCLHSFCLRCVQDHLKHKLSSDNYTCPECHTEFVDKPRLFKNAELATKVEQMSKCQERRPVCDYCFEEDVPAVMGCIQCETFFCVTHLRPHSEKATLKDHALMDPSETTSLRKCVDHKETLKLYCKEDRACICTLCSIIGQHKKHTILTFEEAKSEVQVSVRICFLNFCKAVQHYKEMKSLIEDDEQQTLLFIEAERQAATMYIEVQTKEWVEELDDLTRTIQQINTILNQSDSFRFLKVTYATTVTLDPVTANENLILSEDRTIVRYTDEIQKSPYSPKRFDDTLYVLGSEGFTFGIHYWELVVKSKSDWEVGAAYTSMPRKGKSWLGRNDVSWSLECSGDQYTTWHNNISQKVNIKGKLERVGVYLNYTGGGLVFYDAEKLLPLVSFYHKFTEALYPILNPCNSKGGNFAPLAILQLKGIGHI